MILQGTGTIIPVGAAVTKFDGTAHRSESARWGGNYRFGSQVKQADDLITYVEGVALIDFTERDFQRDGTIHALNLALSTGVLFHGCRFYGDGGTVAGTNYGMSANWVRGMRVDGCLVSNCRAGLQLAGCDGVEIENLIDVNCQTAIGVRNGSTNVLIHRCAGIGPVVIGNTQWPDAPSFVTVDACAASKIEVQGSCKGLKIINSTTPALHLCQIIDKYGGIHSPDAEVTECKIDRIQYYTLDATGKVVKGVPFRGKLTVDGKPVSPVEG